MNLSELPFFKNKTGHKGRVQIKRISDTVDIRKIKSSLLTHVVHSNESFVNQKTVLDMLEIHNVIIKLIHDEFIVTPDKVELLKQTYFENLKKAWSVNLWKLFPFLNENIPLKNCSDSVSSSKSKLIRIKKIIKEIKIMKTKLTNLKKAKSKIIVDPNKISDFNSWSEKLLTLIAKLEVAKLFKNQVIYDSKSMCIKMKKEIKIAAQDSKKKNT